jgi:GMP synthase-like glutamine amidotransferase
MILLVDLCYRPGSLSRDEFVGPVARIVSSAGRVWKETHFSEAGSKDLDGATGIILCGTALKDNLFAERAGGFSWLRNISVPVLGICAGMQVLCLVFGGSLSPGCEIGMTSIRTGIPDPLLPGTPEFTAYELHGFTGNPPPGWVVTAVSDEGIQAVHHPDRPLYGVMFHPEVRNDTVVERFLSLCGEKDT